MNINNHAFLISGGGSGLGAACARALVDGGARVLIADVNSEAGKALAAELGAAARFVAADVTSAEQVGTAVAAARELGDFRGAINCAGIAPPERIAGRDGPHDLERFRRVIEINLNGTFNVLRLAAAALIENAPLDEERGVIINTASVAAFDGQIGQAAYAASKAGVAGLTLPAARELARFGVRVVAIAPGIFDTPMLAGLPQAARDSLGAQVPFPARLGRPQEFAALALHIISNQMLNGEVIRLDGAIRMAPK